MLILDRVLCDECLAYIGQLHHQPAASDEYVEDQRCAPHYAVCPDCQPSLEHDA